MRNAYNMKVRSEIRNAKLRESRSFLRGQLPPSRTQALHQGRLRPACRGSRSHRGGS